MQLTLDGDVEKDGIELMLDDYCKYQEVLNTNKSLMMSPMEFILNRKPGNRYGVFNDNGCILYDKNLPYITIGDDNLDSVDYSFLSIKQKDGFNYKTRKEYIYDINLCLEMKGKNFKNVKRSYKSSCKENLKVIISEDVHCMYDMYEAWRKTEGNKYFQIHDTTLHKNYVTYWDKIKDKMLLVFLLKDDNPIGFIMLEKTNKDFIYLESRKVLSEYIEHTVFFQIELMRILKSIGYNYVCDGGADKKGLSFFKQKFNPILLKTYTLTRKK